MNFLKLILLLTFVVYSGCALTKVTVRKCCGLNEHISKFSNYTYGCLNGTTRIEDYLKVYNPKKGSLVHDIPTNWNIIKSKPNCDNPKIYSHSPIVLFPNGSLFAFDTLIHPDKYCYDYKLAQICDDKPHRPIIKKCCGTNAIYSLTKQNCIYMNVTDYKMDIDQQKYQLISGFPSCEYQMSLLEKFDENMLLENGSLRIHDTDRVLHEGNFCIEHILEKAGMFVICLLNIF